MSEKEKCVMSFDEVLTRVGFGRFNYILIALSGVIITTTILETLGISYVFPVAECDLLLTTQHKGVLSSVASIGIIVSSHLWGFLADTKGRRAVILPTLILSFIASFISSLAKNFQMLLICRFFTGFFIAGSSATIYAYLGEFHNSKERSKVLMIASFIYGISCNYLPILGYFVLNQTFHFHVPLFDVEFKPWRLYLIACSLPSLLSAVVLIFLPESPKFTFSKGKVDETLNILKKIHRMNNPKTTKDFNLANLVEDSEFIDDEVAELTNVSRNPFVQLWKTTRVLLSAKYLRRTTVVCLLQYGFYSSCHGLYMFFPEIVNKLGSFSNQFPSQRSTICEILQFDNEMMANVTVEHCSEKFEVSTFFHSLILELLYMLGFLIITLLITRTSKQKILLVILLTCSVSGFATLFVKIPLLSIYFYVVFMLVLMASNVVSAVTVDLFPTNLRGMAINISTMFLRIGSVMGINVVGFTLDPYCEATFALSAFLTGVCGILAIFIPKITNVRQ